MSNQPLQPSQEFTRLLSMRINEQMIRGVLSNPRGKGEDIIFKVKIRPVSMGDGIKYQATEYVGRQVLHKNYSMDEMRAYITEHMLSDFKQMELEYTEGSATVLVSKKGQMTIRTKRKNTAAGKVCEPCFPPENLFMHNRKKQYLLEEGIPVPFLVDLGVMNRQGEVLKPRYDKFKQINRFLEFVRDILPALPKDREITIIDFGCGKSYLTFAIYYYLHELLGMDVNITGLDLKKDVIRHCNELALKYGYDKLSFQLGNIADYTEKDSVDMVVTLHACDIATDLAIGKAVSWGSKVILSVPCCQHEVNRQIQSKVMEPVLRYGILKERMAALMTDAIRGEALRIKGYKTDILEFIDMEHTPKNLLIRAVLGKETGDRDALYQMIEDYRISPSIVKILDI